MHVNGKTNGSGPAEKLPAMIGIRIGKFEPLIRKWREEHQRVPWTCLLEDGLKLVLAKYAGKRHAHLVQEEDAA